jgi:protein SCO1
MKALLKQLRAQFTFLLAFALGTTIIGLGQERHPASGLILKIDRGRHSMVVSCARIPAYMDAMTMPISVRNPRDLKNLALGTMIDFILVAEKNSAYAESIHTHVYQGLEPDPAAARRLKLLTKASQTAAKPISIGDAVPDFSLTSQDGKLVSLSQFRGKIVALNFIYTRCALPNFCVRSSNNFGELQRRFNARLNKDLVLLTVTFDPVHDSPETLSKYALQFNADPKAWHFLTGPELAVRRACDLFGEDYFPDEGLMDHALHTAIIDRRQRLVANLEGNEFTAQQLGDLVQAVMTSNGFSAPQ